ncbi:MAG: HAMP domain-containing histidine kinase [Saprospiraceae bacterium]|nr:HAMP domain-containing histidine kinase [Bacteroidia bacterium]NNE14562.1 HAMP domain-containing histidine kinase [Saprospiraceae bacterium]NNL93149.1 HAMP domain-containing histidine kinase [Saprospiraceae bacterium]
MFNSANRSSFSLPMLASIILLPCFLIYFINSEYQNEKKSIISEKREKAFENIFSKIDTVSNLYSTQNNSGSVRWVKDTIGNEVSFQLSYVSDSIHFYGHEKSKVLTENVYGPEKSEINIHLNREGNFQDSNFTVKDIKSKHEFVINNIDFTSEDTIIKGTSKDETMTIVQVIDEDNKPSFILSDLAVSNMEVMKRILPQILLSLFLLVSVWLSFFLSARSIKRERQLTELRNDFMSNMSHELKTPVSTISVALEALKNFDAANDANSRKEYIDISKAEVERLGLLVDKALNISLYEQGKFVYEKQIFDLDVQINRVIKTLKIQLENQNVHLEYEKNGQNFFVNADKIHITNVIHNLIENGIKYSDIPASIKISLVESPSFIKVDIADKGQGIPPEFQDKIFDKFFRVPTGNTHNVKGHGLGLSYVKEVVVSQGGQISVISKVGEGSTFSIQIPKIETA